VEAHRHWLAHLLTSIFRSAGVNSLTDLTHVPFRVADFIFKHLGCRRRWGPPMRLGTAPELVLIHFPVLAGSALGTIKNRRNYTSQRTQR
jgi:hypothetical protein